MKIHNVGRAWRFGSQFAQAIFLFSAFVCANGQENSFGERLVNAFAEDLRARAYQHPAPDASPALRRIPPAPFDSPPFPAGDWQIGGTPIIGDPGNVALWPLMEAIDAGPNGDAWKKSRIEICGWEDFSWNVSTSTNTSRGPNANFPLIYDLRPNRFEQNQLFSTSNASWTNTRRITLIWLFASQASIGSIIAS